MADTTRRRSPRARGAVALRELSLSNAPQHSRLQSEPASPSSKRPNAVRGRRRLKSALYFALTVLSCRSAPPAAEAFSTGNRSGLSQRKSEWIDASVQYYSTVMRKNNAGTSLSEVPSSSGGSGSDVGGGAAPATVLSPQHDKDFARLATKHYYARFLIKEGKWDFAEKIYRRIIDELTAENDAEGGQCDHAKLAVSTLLLALHVQRTGDVKATRAVFVNFFRRVAVARELEDGGVAGSDGEDAAPKTKCSCSAKVLQAYALFEMKNGHSAKSLEIIQQAVKMDEGLRPVLGWKQFRDAAAGREYSPTFSFRRRSKAGGGVMRRSEGREEGLAP